MKRILIFFLTAFILIWILYTALSRIDNFKSELEKCNAASTELRFSCYRASLEKHYKDNFSDFLKRLKNNDLKIDTAFKDRKDISYAIFGTNCHTYYHAVGDFVATHARTYDIRTLLSYGPSDCTNGYTMGLYKRLAVRNNFSLQLLVKYWNACKKGAENQCAHEIGHLLHDRYSYSILKIIDDISAKKYGLKYPEKYNYVLFKNEDFNAPYADCRKLVPQNKLAQCYTGIGHNFFVFSEFSQDGYKSAFNICDKTEGENRDTCYSFLIYRIGINEAATRFITHQFDQGKSVCEKVVKLSGQNGMMEHCYRGLGGGIGLFIDSEYAFRKITSQNLVAVKKELMDYLMLCEKSKEGYRDICFSGLFGTRFAKLYDQLKLFQQRIEELRPNWDSDFEVVG